MGQRTIGPLLKQLRVTAGRSQQEQADDLNRRTGRNTDRHQVSDWERGVIPGPYWRGHFAASFGVPVDVLNRAATAARRQRRLDHLSSTTEDDVNRRRFLETAGVSAAQPWGRLATALSGGSVDSPVVRQLTRTTEELYVDEEHIPARLLMDRLTEHLDAITAILPRAGRFRRELVISAGETAALAGWACWDRGEHQDARHYYRTVRDAAREAGHPALEALALVYTSYGAGPDRAAEMLSEAQKNVRGTGYATAAAWVAAREAEERARLGDERRAVRALDRARTSYEYADPAQEQPWVRFLRPSRLDSMAVATYTRLHLSDAVQEAEASLENLVDGNPKVNVAVLCDASMAHLIAGDAERGVEVGRQALDVSVCHGYAGMTMVDVRLNHLARALPDSTTARSLHQDIRAVVA